MGKDIKSAASGKDIKGITAKKAADFNEWYTQLVHKGDLIDNSPVSGCYILKPSAYFIWEQVQQFLDPQLKSLGVKNVYFPLFIPESLLKKEKKHVEGFAPEVAWVETGGHSALGERLAVRPTSETIMYDAYASWIRSHKDLPLQLNQWNNVVRWEFKHPMPFLRSREFLWQEGHTAFATQEEALEEAHAVLKLYEKVFTELLAVPVLPGTKADSEKFAGAETTLSVEVILPNGKAAQGATSHHLGQNFSRAFGIQFADKEQKQQLVWQNSWGLSTRSIGLAAMVHSDDNGLVLPPRIAITQAVVVPILFDDSKKKVLQQAKVLAEKLQKKGVRVHVDGRDEYSPGWKFNEWEVKGVPLRLELGPKDLAKKQATIVRRDTKEKKAVPLAAAEKHIPKLLETMQQDMLHKAQQQMKDSIVTVSSFSEAEKQLQDNKVLFAPWCGKDGCEQQLKEKTGAKSLNEPFTPSSKAGAKKTQKKESCFICGKTAASWFYFGRSY